MIRSADWIRAIGLPEAAAAFSRTGAQDLDVTTGSVLDNCDLAPVAVTYLMICTL